jgi:hypothetical protein
MLMGAADLRLLDVICRGSFPGLSERILRVFTGVLCVLDVGHDGGRGKDCGGGFGDDCEYGNLGWLIGDSMRSWVAWALVPGVETKEHLDIGTQVQFVRDSILVFVNSRYYP